MNDTSVLIPGGARPPYVEGDSLDHGAPLAWTVDGLFTAEECASWIARIEREGPSAAPITTSRGFVMDPDVRNNDRVMFDDRALAAELFERCRGRVPITLNGGRVPVGMNERFRCYRYRAGQYFAPHYDGAFRRDAREASLLTCIVYLNDDFVGGTTRFCAHGVEAAPKVGRALFFQHFLLHEGAPVREGVKYAARSDVMYARPEARG